MVGGVERSGWVMVGEAWVDGCRTVDREAVGPEGVMSLTAMCEGRCSAGETGDSHETGVAAGELVEIELSTGNQGDPRTMDRYHLARLRRSA